MQTYNPADHMVMCRKYKQNLPKLPNPPFPNALGQEIQNTVSAKAWNEWLEHQTMLINENHLSLIDPAAKQFLHEQREKFLDNADYERPKGWTAK
ncbi:oxidative damage protection protein [Moraxella atlantae]|uniref:Probable Fe(2+)-trafficking protein n=1 Tax=Faucicola atlantae TaxID=34059 RepID=A0A1B8QJV4_9GAMM|nr:oxidative damage protection protein [Moraxella atlantae]OBX78292.1 oxidative damage protection protein [Moraxella atlantae]OBX83776.1 oxidative damage protection protein [Moraxella atlantae]OPH36607.1 Fe(2+)-trafficking protein [Moraxella atlantae]STY94368.1 Probable Fe(2+)-trafficking protein [Moraxella atlantae]